MIKKVEMYQAVDGAGKRADAITILSVADGY